MGGLTVEKNLNTRSTFGKDGTMEEETNGEIYIEESTKTITIMVELYSVLDEQITKKRPLKKIKKLISQLNQTAMLEGFSRGFKMGSIASMANNDEEPGTQEEADNEEENESNIMA